MNDTPLDRLRHVYCNTPFWELHNIQRVHIDDYYDAVQAGEDNRADRILATINNFGLLLEERERNDNG